MENKCEIKIIIDASDNGILVPHKVIVYVNDEAIGCLQDITFHASVNEPTCSLDVTFPNLKSNDIPLNFKQESTLLKQIDEHIEKFANINGVKVNLKDIFEK